MNLRTSLILMTALAVVTDNLIIPFYPQYFAERFGQPPAWHVGAYLAAVSLVVMSVFPLWARLAKRVHPVRILVSAQFMAGTLTAACFFIDNQPLFWAVSLAMVVFKGSYLLMYPYVMSLEAPHDHPRTIGTLSVVVHFGAILGAALGGLLLQGMSLGAVFLVMAAADFIQMAICMRLVGRKLPAPGEAAKTDTPTADQPPVQHARNLPAIHRLCVVMFLFYCFGYVTRPFFAVYWQGVAQWNSEMVAGFVYSVPGAVAMVALWWSRRASQQSDHRQGILAGLLLCAAATAIQGLDHQWVILLGRLLFGWSLYQVTVGLDALMFRMSTPEHYAVDFSKINIFQAAGNMLSAYGAGILIVWNGHAVPFWAGAAGLLLTAVVFAATLGRTAAAVAAPTSTEPK
ncbi:MAG: MFS transporter [Polaromonas sp.]|nr:MFS transporter [Polaromonas sp.]